MNRKWRTNPGAIESVLSLPTFEKLIPPRDAEYTLATTTDLYALYVVLHIEKKGWELRWSSQGQFYFFVATERIYKLEAPAVPEIDTGELSDAGDPEVHCLMPTLKTFNAPKIEDKAKDSSDGLQVRIQIVVPLSSSSNELTPRLLRRVFAIKGVQAQQLLLAFVDANGNVSRTCLYNYIQSPLEGPGTADLELLDEDEAD